jgi:hypothetical protein
LPYSTGRQSTKFTPPKQSCGNVDAIGTSDLILGGDDDLLRRPRCRGRENAAEEAARDSPSTFLAKGLLVSSSRGDKTIEFGDAVIATLTFYLYGDQAAENVARETPLWEAWFQKHFPMPTEPGKSE